MAVSIPQYQHSRTVGAMQIAAVHPAADTLEFKDRHIKVPAQYFNRFSPVPGGYYTQHNAIPGYESEATFNSDYTLVKPKKAKKTT